MKPKSSRPGSQFGCRGVLWVLAAACTAAAMVLEQTVDWQVWAVVLFAYILSPFGAIVIPAKKYE